MVSCCRLGEVQSISHDSVNRFLNRESYGPLDLYNEVKSGLDLQGGTLSVDDTVLDKPYANYIAYIGYYWSGKHHKVTKGINLITLYYTDKQGNHQPVNFRVYDKKENKSKHDYFLEMLSEILSWGLKPFFITGDSWYSCVRNLKQIRDYSFNFLFAVESNRLVSIEKGIWTQIQTLDIPEDGLTVWLKDFGYTKIFRTRLKDQVRHYAMYLSNGALDALNHTTFDLIHGQHWDIEQYHRTIKQVCNIENFQVRGKVAVKNHIFSAILGFTKLQTLRVTKFISNCYRLRRDLFNQVIAAFISTMSPTMEHMNAKFLNAVNA